MTDIKELMRLPVDQRLKLIGELWDSLESETETAPLHDWQRAELDARLDALEQGTSVGSPWHEVRRRITGSS